MRLNTVLAHLHHILFKLCSPASISTLKSLLLYFLLSSLYFSIFYSLGCVNIKTMIQYRHDSNPSTIRPNIGMLSASSQSRRNQQFRCIECNIVCPRKWLQVEGAAKRVRKLAYNIYTNESLGKKRNTPKRIPTLARKRNNHGKC